MSNKRLIKRTYNVVVVLLMLGCIAYVCSRFMHFGNYVYTDNAMAHRSLTPVNTRVQGFIKEIRFKEFQYVHKGDTLLVLEDAQFRLALAQAEANAKGVHSGAGAVSASINTTQSNVQVASESMKVAGAGIAEAQAGMENARKDFERYGALLQRGAVTQQQYDHEKTLYEEAVSRYNAAKARLQQASASRRATATITNQQRHQLGQSEAGINVALAQLDVARLNLSYTVITAPCDGYIGRKSIYVGQLVQPGQFLVSVVDMSSVWVIANYRETQMKHIKIGEKVDFTADALPDIVFHGKVKSISYATGVGYSGVPVDNATGNFVKVEQRIPVRIELTNNNRPEDVKRLIDGLNVETKIYY